MGPTFRKKLPTTLRETDAPARPSQSDRNEAINIYIGRNLRSSRQARGLSQGLLAALLGTSGSRIDAYERGIERVEPQRLLELSDLLHVTISSFFEPTRGRKP